MTRRIEDHPPFGFGVRLATALFSAMLLVSSQVIAQGQEATESDSASGTSGMAMNKPCKKGHMGALGGMGGHGKTGDKRGMMGHRPQGQGKHHGHGGGWKASLSEAQQQQMKTLKVAHMKIALPLKMKMEAVKAELAALATADSLDQAALEAKIDDLLWHKRLRLIEKYRFMAAKRQLLTPEQRLDFDMAQMKRLNHGNKGKHGKH